ncbi:MAG: AraC family transcriptional regulator [Acetatifactor sp.]|nr:AraC family transcriptional regulator [Acetatifactor sp.]
MKDKLFYKHIILYASLLLLPVVAFSGFMQISILEKIRLNYAYQLENRMIGCANDLEGVFSSLDTVRVNVVYGDNFSFNSDLSNVEEAKEVLRELQSFAINNPILKEVIFWYEGDEFAYLSTTSTFRKDKLRELYPLFALKSVDDILEEEKNGHVETYLFQTFPEGTVPVRTICHTSVLINGRRALLIFLMKMPEADILDNLVVYDRQGNIQYSCNMDEGLSEMLREGTLEGYYEIRVEKESRIYVQYYNPDIVYADFMRIRHLYWCIIVFVLVVGVVLIFFGIKNNLLPMLWRRQELTNAVQFNFLYNLLKGKYAREEFEERVEKDGMLNLRGDLYFLIVFLLQEDEAAKDNEEVEAVLHRYLKGYMIELPEERKFVYVGAMDRGKAKNYREFTWFMWKDLERETKIDISFSFSPLFENIDDIQQIFLKTVLSMEFKFAKGNSCYIDSEQVLDEELVEVTKPKKLIEQLLLNTRLANTEEVNRIMDEINSHVKTSGMPPVYSKMVCYNLIMQVMELLHSCGMLENGERVSYSVVMARTDTVDELTDKIRNIANNICLFLTEKKKKDSETEIAGIEQFMRENVLLEKFSVQYMADWFGMSPSNLSNFYKQKTGMTIMERVTDIRMKQAEEYLLDEDNPMTLNEIVEKIGYNNTSSFIRKFKSIYGVTPGQFVKAKKEK